MHLGFAGAFSRHARHGHSVHGRPRHHTFSLSRWTTEAEIDRVIDAVPPIAAQLRKLSPYWNGDGPAEDPEKAFAPAYA
jgi:cysteine desulfurase